MTPGVKLNNKDIIDALRKTNGNLTLTGQLLGCTREAIRLRVNRYPEIKQVLDEARESVIDVAEGALQRAVLNGEAWAIALTLKTIGKRRGYVEKTEQEITGLMGVQFIDNVPRDATKPNSTADNVDAEEIY